MPNCIYCGVYHHSQANLKQYVKLSLRYHQAFTKQISKFNTNAANEDIGENAASESDPKNKASQSANLLQEEEEITVEGLHDSLSMCKNP
jgi:hypothetical protein